MIPEVSRVPGHIFDRRRTLPKTHDQDRKKVAEGPAPEKSVPGSLKRPGTRTLCSGKKTGWSFQKQDSSILPKRGHLSIAGTPFPFSPGNSRAFRAERATKRENQARTVYFLPGLD
ncbi:hypothetical protein BOX24_03800 [Leptospirillum ferriphilum]|uniref:Uncharacterized protein n=1 Tax=Leptospirillum ferriphilum TaxID=178606 RepID=A0A1V3SWI3_9BACT|nr:hypothetical protein BOX24_03800 [Leptospirillum ferriphilum]